MRGWFVLGCFGEKIYSILYSLPGGERGSGGGAAGDARLRNGTADIRNGTEVRNGTAEVRNGTAAIRAQRDTVAETQLELRLPGEALRRRVA